MNAQCTAKRWDGYDLGTVPPAPPCGHAVCAADGERHRRGYLEDEIWACPAGRCELAWAEAQCELDAGHAGEHQYPSERSDPATWGSSIDLTGLVPAAGGAS